MNKLPNEILTTVDNMIRRRIGITEFQTPDGHRITLGKERFLATEELFNPSANETEGSEFHGVHKMLYDAICKCDVDIRDQLWSSIVLDGCTTMLPGFRARLVAELKALAPPGQKINICDNGEDPSCTVWRGGSKLSVMPTFMQEWTSKEEYDESGTLFTFDKRFIPKWPSNITIN
jgi:actin-related protein